MEDLKALQTELAILRKQIKDLTVKVKVNRPKSIRKRGQRKSTVERDRENYLAYMNGLVAKMHDPAVMLAPTELVDCLAFLQRG